MFILYKFSSNDQDYEDILEIVQILPNWNKKLMK